MQPKETYFPNNSLVMRIVCVYSSYEDIRYLDPSFPFGKHKSYFMKVYAPKQK